MTINGYVEWLALIMTGWKILNVIHLLFPVTEREVTIGRTFYLVSLAFWLLFVLPLVGRVMHWW